MKLWHISQSINSDEGAFDNAVVAAESEEACRQIHPGNDKYDASIGGWVWQTVSGERKVSTDWARSPKQVTARLLGEAAEGIQAGVIVASFIC
jgi:hypothetical protein